MRMDGAEEKEKNREKNRKEVREKTEGEHF